ncbi:MAG: hypothetical protein ACYTEL_11615 [Planctomycetota bacterium]|jgi:hypothetical protein
MLSHPIFWYLAGVLSAIIAYIFWRRLHVILMSRSALREAEAVGPEPTGPSEQEAREYIDACQKRLLLQTKLNPDWVEPLKDELPRLVQEIARTFYPEATNPLLAPGVSEFARAIELSANDIATFFQISPYGRLLDVSANTAQWTYNAAKKLPLKQMLKWYKRVRPVVQIIKYKSLLMWTFFLGRNYAVRALHVTIAGIVGKRAIELYSGKLAK